MGIGKIGVGLLLAGTILVTSGATWAADPDEPHPHRGVLEPFEAARIGIDMSDNMRNRLAAGELVTMTLPHAGGGKAVGILDVAAPSDTVWSRITDFSRYPEWIGPVKICEVYARQENETRTRTVISDSLYSYEYFLVTTLYPDNDMMIWTLDYDRYSDFDDCVGVWYVESHPGRDGWSRIWFGCDLKLQGDMSNVMMDYATEQGLKDATSWVKRESERAGGG